MKHTLGLIKISAKSLLRKNSGNKLLLIAICILTLVPMFLYNTTNSIIATVKDQRTAVYGIFDEIYYREQVSELSTFTDETFEGDPQISLTPRSHSRRTWRFPAPLQLSLFSPPDGDRRVDSPALSGRGSQTSRRTSG